VDAIEVGGSYLRSEGEPHFADIPKLWELYAARPRTVAACPPVEGLDVLADFAKHFPTDGVAHLFARSGHV